jgi:hypothetical protein
MRQPLLLLSILTFALLSFVRQDNNGKVLFEQNCSSCYSPNKILVAPPFQRIRKDYGLNWTVNFVNNYDSMLRARDSKALYIYHSYNELLQTRFDNLNKDDIIKILDYVDTFPFDSLKYSHRKVSESERQKYILRFEAH